MKEKSKEFLGILEKADGFTSEQWKDFEEKFENYLKSLTEGERKHFYAHQGKEVIKQLLYKRDGIPFEEPVKNPKLKEYIKKIKLINSKTPEKEIVNLSNELNEYLHSLPEEERNEFVQTGYGEMLEMCCP